uniref:Uncharacterized protein n=1 Tax=Cacopsylla melanoneura TaxID=428564 RepID=A0A8D8PU15_9HEMI
MMPSTLLLKFQTFECDLAMISKRFYKRIAQFLCICQTWLIVLFLGNQQHSRFHLPHLSRNLHYFLRFQLLYRMFLIPLPDLFCHYLHHNPSHWQYFHYQ